LENNEEHKIEDPALNIVPANLAKRLANYFIDIVFFSFLLYFLLKIIAPFSPLANKFLTIKPETVELMDQLILSFIYGLYMSVAETLLKGKTIGKYITGTRAVTENGQPINAQTAFVRGLIRIIPFEQLSAISFPPYPWHDRWSKSIVADEAKSLLPKN
jgi:uncharacterized RDD family membrane protein YckC